MKAYQLGAILTRFNSTSDRGLRLTFETTKELSLEISANVQFSLNKVGVLVFSPDPFTSQEMEEIDKIKIDFEDTTKTAGQRLRGVLYHLWKQEPEGYKTFPDYYASKMEVIIEHFKKKLDD
jgi:hypothetical protein